MPVVKHTATISPRGQAWSTMTVEALIADLQQLPPDALVRFGGYQGYDQMDRPTGLIVGELKIEWETGA